MRSGADHVLIVVAIRQHRQALLGLFQKRFVRNFYVMVKNFNRHNLADRRNDIYSRICAGLDKLPLILTETKLLILHDHGVSTHAAHHPAPNGSFLAWIERRIETAYAVA